MSRESESTAPCGKVSTTERSELWATPPGGRIITSISRIPGSSRGRGTAAVGFGSGGGVGEEVGVAAGVGVPVGLGVDVGVDVNAGVRVAVGVATLVAVADEVGVTVGV
jgi:hypothetical protein